MAIHSSILVWKIPWTEKPGGPQSMGLQRVGHDWVTEHTHTQRNWTSIYMYKYVCVNIHICVCVYICVCVCVYPFFFFWSFISRNWLTCLRCLSELHRAGGKLKIQAGFLVYSLEAQFLLHTKNQFHS